MERGKRDPRTCNHAGPTLVDRADGGFVATCLLCGMPGPERENAEEARRALLGLVEGDRKG